MKKIIFLDFDGVLNPSIHKNYLKKRFDASGGTISGKDEHGYHFDPYCVANLDRIINRTGAGLVISSSWRLHVDLHKMWSERKLPGIVMDMIPTFSTEKDRSNKTDNAFHRRGEEVAKWLHEQKMQWSNEYKDYVILDDHPEIFLESQSERMIACDYRIGLTTADTKRAIEILS